MLFYNQNIGLGFKVLSYDLKLNTHSFKEGKALMLKFYLLILRNNFRFSFYLQLYLIKIIGVCIQNRQAVTACQI